MPWLKESKLTSVVLLLVALVGIIGYLGGTTYPSDSLYAVSTTSGQFFVGELSFRPFSKFILLKNPFVLQNVQDNSKNSVTPQLIDLSVESYWHPKEIYINSKEIVFKGKVSDTSPIGMKIKEYKAGLASPASPSPAPVPAPGPVPMPAPAPAPSPAPAQ